MGFWDRVKEIFIKSERDNLEKQVEKEKLERAEQAKGEIEAVLERYKCVMHPYPFLDEEGRTKAAVEIVAL